MEHAQQRNLAGSGGNDGAGEYASLMQQSTTPTGRVALASFAARVTLVSPLVRARTPWFANAENLGPILPH